MKLKALTCPSCGDTVDVKNEASKFVFCSTCGSKLIIDDQIQRVEHTIKGSVKIEGIDKVEELAEHIKTAGGGSSLHQAQSKVSFGILKLNSGDCNLALKAFNDAILSYAEYAPALLGICLCATSDNGAHARILLKTYPEIQNEEKEMLKKVNTNILILGLSMAGIYTRLDYVLTELCGQMQKYQLTNALGTSGFWTGWTPMTATIQSGNLAVPTIQVLLKHGASLNGKSSDGHTALSWAKERGNHSAVNFLESQGGKKGSNKTRKVLGIILAIVGFGVLVFAIAHLAC